MIIVSDLTREIALELFDYDQVAGKLYWKAELPEKYFPSDAIRRMVQTKVGGKRDRYLYRGWSVKEAITKPKRGQT